MNKTAFALPVSAEKLPILRDFVGELLGARREEFERSWRDKGIRAETAWLQSTQEGALVLVVIEANDLERAFEDLATSDSDFDRWYRARVLGIYGVDLTNPSSPTELLASWTDSQA